MDHSWRPPSMPPIPVNNNRNICPICSISHFPFCPPPPFAENPRFHYAQPQHNYNRQRPYFDHHLHHPFPNHQTLNYNYDYNPIDGRRPNWHETNPSLDMSPYAGSASYGYDGYDNGGIKRMKIEPIDNNKGPIGSYISGGIGDTSRCFPSDNERILKLIHDHGNAANAHQRFGETCEVRDDLGLKRHRDEVGQSQFDLDYSRHNSQPTADSMQNHNLKGHNYQQPYNWSESKGQPNSFGGQPPLPASPPPPLPINPPTIKPYLFPVSVSSSTDSLSSRAENQSSAHVYYTNNSATLSSAEEFHKPNIIDASHIFKHPHRASRPDHLVIILRGLPGSGKSYLSKMLRDIEVENGGEAPRIHSMDEYFMTEVEKAEDSEVAGSLRGKRQVMKTVMEYCYEPEMEEAYRASMLKAFKKTLDEGVYSFIIVDDRNLRVADFAQFWATAKRSGYEVYLVEASYKDPAGCAARNVHNFSLDDIQKMATQWEEAPSLYLKMDIKSLLHGDGFDESGIQEVDMDMEDEDASQGAEIKSPQDNIKDEVNDFTHDDVNDHNPMKKNEKEQVKDLSKSKWSNNNDLDGNDLIEAKDRKNGLSGLIQAYSKEGKSLQWGDQGGNIGFSISASRKTNTKSLVIGPGPGYNLKSNPLSEEVYVKPAVESKSQSVFQEQIRAERESFKAVFDKRKHRINMYDE